MTLVLKAILYGSVGRAGTSSSMETGGLKYYIQRHPVDCIVITGDLFDRGIFSTTAKNSLKSFLTELYSLCSEASKSMPDARQWKWSENDPMDRLFYCPGNHDLDRNATYKDETSGAWITRNEILHTSTEQGEFLNTQHSHNLLTTGSFGDFFSTLQELRTGKENSPVSPVNCEAQLFSVPNLNPLVTFLSINTALLAGRFKEQPDLDAKLVTSFKKFEDLHRSLDTRNALNAYKDYSDLVMIHKKEAIDDFGQLCFISKDTSVMLEQHLHSIELPHITILFGHHPTSFLSEEAQNVLKPFVRNNQISLYLRGHTHTPEISKTSLRDEDNDYLSRWEVGVGGLFKNKDDKFNQLSFSVGTIMAAQDNTTSKPFFSCNTQILTYVPSFRRWTQLVKPVNIDLISTSSNGFTGVPPNDSAGAPNKSVDENMSREKPVEEHTETYKNAPVEDSPSDSPIDVDAEFRKLFSKIKPSSRSREDNVHD